MTLVLTPITNGELTLSDFPAGVSTVESLTVEPPITGLFTDFSNGQNGTDVTVRDPGSPARFDTVTATGSTVQYDSSVVCEPQTRSVKIVNSSASVAYMSWVAGTFGEPTEDYGRIYVYLTAAPNQTIRLVQWQGGGGSRGRIVIGTDRFVKVHNNASVQQGIAAAALSTGTWYRIEWHMVCDTSSGGVTVRVYAGNSSTMDETLSFESDAFNTGSYFDQFDFGSVNNSNLGNNAHYVGAVAAVCSNWPGPYTGEQENAIMVGQDETPWAAIDRNGELVIYNRDPFLLSLGTNHYQVPAGAEVLRVERNGSIRIGRNLLLGQTSDANSGDNVTDILLSSMSGRINAASFEIIQVNDPPDITFTRFSSQNSEKSGSDAAVVNGSTSVTVPTGDFQTIDKDKGISLNSVTYNIAAVTSETTITLTEAYAGATGTVSWSMDTYPYPSFLTSNTDTGAIGQLRWLPTVPPFVRSGTDGVKNGSSYFAAATGAFSSSDVGRAIMLSNDTTQVFSISSVSSTSSITLSSAASGSASNVPWAISKAPTEGGAVRSSTLGATITGKMAEDARKWGTSGSVYSHPMDLHFNLLPAGLYAAGVDGTDVLILRSTGNAEVSGKVLATGGLGVGNSAAGTVLGSVVKKIQVFDDDGTSLGYLPVYDAIT